MTRRWKLIFLFLFFHSFCFAQITDWGKAGQPDTVSFKSPGQAVFMSILLPGAGNFYAGKKLNGVIHALVGAAGIAIMVEASNHRVKRRIPAYKDNYLNYILEKIQPEKGKLPTWFYYGLLVWGVDATSSAITAYQDVQTFNRIKRFTIIALRF